MENNNAPDNREVSQAVDANFMEKFDELKAENKKIIELIKDGGLNTAQEKETVIEVDSKELVKEFFTNSLPDNITNLDYAKKFCTATEAFISDYGWDKYERDFPSTLNQSVKLVGVLKAAIETAEDDPERFNIELKRRTLGNKVGM